MLKVRIEGILSSQQKLKKIYSTRQFTESKSICLKNRNKRLYGNDKGKKSYFLEIYL